MVGGVGIDPNCIADSMVSVSNAFNKNSRIRLHHRRIGQEYQIAFALHEDTDYPHLHFVFNAVSFIDGHRYRTPLPPLL